MKKTIKSLLAIAVAAFAFTACSDVPEPEGYNPNQGDNVYPFNPTGAGTKEDPYTSADAIAYAKSLNQKESTNKVFIKGKVSKIETTFAASGTYGNAVFYISDDGNADVKDQQFYVYRALYLGNKKYTSTDTDIKVGDDVVVKARVINYKGNTPETVQNTAFLYSLNGVDRGDEEGGEETADQPKGTGTLENPFNVAAAVAKCKDAGETATAESYYIKGKVKEVKEQFSTQNGNGTFTIVDNGFTQIFTAYRVLYLGNKKFKTGDTEIKEGDEVIIYAKLINYKGNTPETSGGYLYSLNGNTGGGGEPVTYGPEAGNGTEASPYNVAAAYAKCVAAGTNPSTESYYITGIANAEYTVTSYKNVEVDIVDNGYTGTFTVFRVKDKEGKGIKQGYKINKGDVLVVYGPVVNYQGTTPETATGAYLVSVNGQAPELEEGGGDSGEGGGGSGAGSLDGNVLTLNCAGLGLANNPASLTLVDGTTLTFSKNDGSTAPAYNSSYGELRFYARNSFSIAAGTKTISKVKLYCTANQGTPCVGNDGEVTASSGTLDINKETMIIEVTNVGNSSFTLTNGFAEKTSGGTQLRFNKLEITYAN